MADTISWIATSATIVAASMTAANLGTRITGYGFCVFLVGSLAWLLVGLMTHQAALSWTNVVLTALNLFGIWRWLGRQKQIEEGASNAAAASERTKGDDLFPISLLIKAQIHGSDSAVGSCVDAMAGCSTGQLRYIVASQGGVAGMGETLRRLPWSAVRVDGENLAIDADDLSRFEEIAKNKWPAS